MTEYQTAEGYLAQATDEAALAVAWAQEALEAARKIRDRAQAAAGRGVRADDVTEMQNASVALTAAARSIYAQAGDLAGTVQDLGKRISPDRRQAVIARHDLRPTPEEVTAYLPRYYQVDSSTDEEIVIGGIDNAGWGLDTYVIPRLGSGMIFARERQAS